QADLELAYVKSPIEGQILEINTWSGELVNKTEGIVEVGNTENMYVVAEVYETDIARISIGQRAIITSGGIMPKLTGTVDDIGWQIGTKDVLSTDPVADVDARVVEVKIRLNPEDSQKVASLTNLQVNVIIETSKQIQFRD
nr:HlyD family efflux transporter periplasmic adaptor subunit [Xenococcaceae cyanobacterium MO_188.B19]